MIESPSGRVPKKAPRWDLMGTEACGGGKLFWWTLVMFGEYLRIYKGGTRVCGLLGTLLALSPSHVGVFWSNKNHRKVLFRLDSV